MSTQYKATCKCGATIDVPYSDNFKDWLNSHKECLKQQAMPRTWVGLTDEEVADIERNSITRRQAIRAIEAKLKDKNL